MDFGYIMENYETWLPITGALFFGAVVGWLAHNVLKSTESLNVAWLASMIGVVGGGAVTAYFQKSPAVFGAYCIGLGLLFFTRVIIHPITTVVSEEMRRQDLADAERKKRAQAKKDNAAVKKENE
jgi:uncharacterized membrane protein YeaQ/YmgE (transglycosylase-associated protein family)